MLKNPNARIQLTLSYLETLGHALIKAFQTPLVAKEPERSKQSHLRHLVSIELSKASMNKLWEENFVTNALQNKLALKTEQLQVADEKSTIQGNLVALAKRRQNIAEKEMARLQERDAFLTKEIEQITAILKDQVRLSKTKLDEMKSSFIERFED